MTKSEVIVNPILNGSNGIVWKLYSENKGAKGSVKRFFLFLLVRVVQTAKH